MFTSAQLKNLTDYFVVWALIAVSGFPYFMISQAYFTILFVVVLILFFKRSLLFDPRTLIVFGAFLLVESMQFLFIKPYDPIMIMGTFIRLSVAMIIIKLVSVKFTQYFTNIIVFFTVLSFFFFIPSIVYPGFFNFFKNSICPLFDSPFADKDSFYQPWPTIIIYCFHECILKEFRNPGPFWEPGLFAVFLNLALLFNLIEVKRIITVKNVILIVGILSTFSTAGYMALLVLIYTFYIVNQNTAKQIIFTIISLPLILLAYYSLDILSAKIEDNINLATTTTSSRFGSALADISDFSTSPFIGWGRGLMRYGGRLYTFFSDDQHRNNSVTDLLASYGIFIFVFYFYCYYRGFRLLCQENKTTTAFAAFALVVVLMLGFSQSIFLRPFCYSFLFIQFNYNKQSQELQ